MITELDNQFVTCTPDQACDDLFKILDAVPEEVEELLQFLRAGRIDGAWYGEEHDPPPDCVCLAGTLARLRGTTVQALPFRTNLNRPAEVWFYGIDPDHTPENNVYAAHVESWILEWQALRGEGELVL